ncbi:MAG TPA: DUF2235 domain-containing protein [Afifellaceae bacterium]|nr:DUF2235 domain-containing protein [Afifellaceae bacterium]
MPRNIVICCDGTGNEINENISNVLKLFRCLKQDDTQLTYYDPGVGTLSHSSAWGRFKLNAKLVFGLATGWGLDAHILQAYRFLIDHYEEGDRIFLFGFSRGAYTVRALAGFLYLVGLLRRDQANLSSYGLVAYKQASEKDDLKIAWRFHQISRARRLPIHFVGVWDTVSSMIVPRPDRFYIPSLQVLPYTRTNPGVEIFRHAISIDERRRMFRLNQWWPPVEFKPDPFADSKKPHDCRQLWFAGTHSDIGGGWPEPRSGLSKIALLWMIEEAKAHGLKVNTQMVNHLVKGAKRKGGRHEYVPPDPAADINKSMNWAWRILEWLPKSCRWKEWPPRPCRLGLYLPRAEPRYVDHDMEGLHPSVPERMRLRPDYRPENLDFVDPEEVPEKE